MDLYIDIYIHISRDVSLLSPPPRYFQDLADTEVSFGLKGVLRAAQARPLLQAMGDQALVRVCDETAANAGLGGGGGRAASAGAVTAGGIGISPWWSLAGAAGSGPLSLSPQREES